MHMCVCVRERESVDVGVHECICVLCVQIRVCMRVYVMCVHADMDVGVCGWVFSYALLFRL